MDDKNKEMMKIMMPVIRRITPSLIADEILGVQPMGPISKPKPVIGEFFETPWEFSLKRPDNSHSMTIRFLSLDDVTATPCAKVEDEFIQWFEERGLKPTEDYCIMVDSQGFFFKPTVDMTFLFRDPERMIEFKLTYQE